MNLFAKYTYDVNASNMADLCVLPGTELSRVGAGLEYFPIEGVTTNPTIISKEKTDFIKKHNITFDESYKIAADYKFTMQTVVNGKHFLKVPYCISLFDTTGISSNNMDQGLQEADRARKEILKMGYFKRQFIIIASKLSRFIKENLNFIYKLYR